MSEDEGGVDPAKLPTVSRFDMARDGSLLKRNVITPDNAYSPKKKRLLEHISTEYSSVSSGGSGEILSPTYREEIASPKHSLLSPHRNNSDLRERGLWGQQQSRDPDWVSDHDRSHDSVHSSPGSFGRRKSSEGSIGRQPSSEGEHIIQIKQSGGQASTEYSDAALKMMKGMGYSAGGGLGKEGQGIIEPVAAALKKGNRGLGHHTDGFKSTHEDWKERPISTHVPLEWMGKPSFQYDEAYFKSPPIQQLIGPRKDTVDDETRFVSSDILTGIQKAKTIFDELPDQDLRDARTRSNPFESIASVIFQNRAAMKMAEVDAMSGWAFSQQNKNYDTLASPIYFGDICAGPGGFSEYMLWRTQWHGKGFGMTLKHATDASDFKLNKFLMGPPECFEPYYGSGGADGDGDILKPENLEEFKDYVLQQTGGQGLSFVMADGGISVEGQENIQEILTKQLLLCQFACALSVLKQDGSFMCKTFDLYTPFSVGLVHLLRYAFEKVAVIKPLTSRPANSERYVLCLGCDKKVAGVLYEYLFKLNMEIRKLASTDRDVQHVVPLSHFMADSDFCRYITKSNDVIGDNQLYHLQKLRAYVRNPGLRVANQNEIREICLKKWEVPNEMRKRRFKEQPMDTAERLLNSSLFKGSPCSLNLENMGSFSSRYSWKCHLDYGKPVLLLGQGKKDVYYFNGDLQTWTRDPHIQIQLPRDTIIEAQVAEVFAGDGGGLRSYHVIFTDAIVIGGQEVSGKPYSERIVLLERLSKTIKKDSVSKTQVAISVKPLLFRLEHFYTLANSLKVEYFKGHSAPRLAHCIKDKKILVNGIAFIRHIKEPWNMELSNKLKKFYFFNCKSKNSQYDWPTEAAADFAYTRLSSLHWQWDAKLWSQVLQESPVTDKLLEAFIHKLQLKPPKQGSETPLVHK